MLLPTDHNKLLMQWKGPFEVSSVVGLNDYKVEVKGKEKVYHASLLKKYFGREEATTVEVAVGEGADLSKNDDVKAEVEGVDPVDDVDFLEISACTAKESDVDVATGENFTSDQRADFMDLAMQFQGRLSEQSRGIT